MFYFIPRESAEGYETRGKSESAVKQPRQRSTLPDQLRGQKVVARKTEDGLYYSGMYAFVQSYQITDKIRLLLSER